MVGTKRFYTIFTLAVVAVLFSPFLVARAAQTDPLIVNNLTTVTWLVDSSTRSHFVQKSVNCELSTCGGTDSGDSATTGGFPQDGSNSDTTQGFTQVFDWRRDGGGGFVSFYGCKTTLVNGFSNAGGCDGELTPPIAGNAFPTDSAWHTIFFSTKILSAKWAMCLMIDDTDVTDCSWVDSGQTVSGWPQWSGFTLRADAGTTMRMQNFRGAVAPAPPDHTTHFTSFTPTLGTTTPNATSTSFTFGATGYIAESDFATSSTVLYIRYLQQTGQGQNGNSLLASQGSFSITATSSGEFSLSTTTPILNTGVYSAYYSITRPAITIFGINFFSRTLKSAIGTFIVGAVSQTDIDSVQLLTNTTGGGFVDTTIPTTDNEASSTVLGMGGAFGIAAVVLQKFPINWVVEYANVLTDLASSTATTTIPDVTVSYAGLKEIQNIPTTTTQNLSVTFFSASTLDTVGAYPAIILMRTVIGWSLWIGLIFMAWRRANGLFSQAQM